MRIDVAYCSELDRIVDIDEACLEFIAQDSANAKPFTFLCSDPICRERKKTMVCQLVLLIIQSCRLVACDDLIIVDTMISIFQSVCGFN